MIVVYTLPCCPNCQDLKEKLKLSGKSYVERDMSDPASITEMRVNGYFGIEAPVARVGDDFFTYEEALDALL